MCTMTVVPLSGGRMRVAFNRDEPRGLAAGRPPQQWQAGQRMALLSTAPASGGTWLAVNNAGLVLALLDATPDVPSAEPVTAARARSEVISALLGCDSPAAALGAVEQVFDSRDFAPFRLVLVGSGVAADVRWDGSQAMVVSRLIGGTPLLYTSSGLGDGFIEGERRALFADAFAGPASGWAAAQDAFHRHTSPGREHLSVNITRSGARTASLSVVEVGNAGAAFAYYPDGPDRPAEDVVHHLPFTAAAAP